MSKLKKTLSGKKQTGNKGPIDTRNIVLWIAIGVATLAIIAGVIVAIIDSRPKIHDYSDPNAPKVIVSENLTDYCCLIELKEAFPDIDQELEYWNVDMDYKTTYITEEGEELPLPDPYVSMNLEYVLKDSEEVHSLTDIHLTKDHYKKLQEIIKKYDLAQYNGLLETKDTFNPGPAIDFAANYESGEELYISSNYRVPVPYEYFKETWDYILTLLEETGNAEKNDA